MNYYQLIYNASESRRSGGPGFGIRAVSENFPEYLLPLIDERFTSYHSGTFGNIPGSRLAENPEIIHKYPKSFIYRAETLSSGKTVYCLGRTVATGFDYPYFKTGDPSTRTGNYVSHLYIFDEAPDKSVFDILFGKPLEQGNSFLPVDTLPTVGNEELKSLMLGPSHPLPVPSSIFASSVKGIPQASVDILFDLVAALNEGKKLVVKMPCEKAPEACAGLMRLLPEKYARGMTFSINHQSEGIDEGLRIIFINEYYPYQAPAGNVFVADYLVQCHVSSPLEAKWRKELETAIENGDFAYSVIISQWMLNKLSSMLVNLPDELNRSMIRYFYISQEFTLAEVMEVEGLLPLLARLIKADASKGKLLEDLLIREFEEAADYVDVNKLIDVCQSIAAAGIHTETVLVAARGSITDLVASSPRNVRGILNVHSCEVLKKYLDTGRTPRYVDVLSNNVLRDIWDKAYSIYYPAKGKETEIMLKMQCLELDQAQIKNVLKEICPEPSERVKMYIARLREHPEEMALYKPFLEWDKAATQQIDWVSLFKDRFGDEQFATYFLQSIDNGKDNLNVVDTLKLCSEISSLNKAFKEILIANRTIYALLFRRLVSLLKGKSPKALDTFIDSSVLPLIAESDPAHKQWTALRDVLKAEEGKDTWSAATYSIALEIGASDYLRLVSGQGFKHFNTLEEVSRFTDALISMAGMSAREILAKVKEIKSSTVRSYYIVALAQKAEMPFQKVMEVTDYLAISSKEEFYSEFFKKEYRLQKFKNIFKKKTVTLLILLLCAVVAYAQESFGNAAEDATTRYRVNTKKSVNIRKSPSKNGQWIASAHDGDYIYCNHPEIVSGDGLQWLKFYQTGEGFRYIAYSYLSQEDNPLYVEKDVKVPSFWWLPMIFVILFAFISFISIFLIGRKYCHKYSPFGYKWYDVFFLGLRQSNGMRRIWVFNPNAYISFSSLSGSIIGSFFATSLLILLIASVTLAIFYIVGGLIWALIVIGWILVVGGALVLFFGKSPYGLIGALGIPVVIYNENLANTASDMFEQGVVLFNSMNPIDLTEDIFLTYWKPALIIAAIPMIVFLVLALLWLIVAALVSLYETIVMARYNVKHPCPNCGLSCEPAQYVTGRNADGTPILLPVHLRPGVYGIFSLRTPFDGKKIPTLFLNGKDKLERMCPHCQTYIKADLGEEKHVAVAGVAQSGKTTLLYRIIAQLKHNYNASITDNMGANHTTIESFVGKIENGEQLSSYPPKTSESRHRSIQMIIPRKGAAVPYKLYLNDLAGEMFTAQSNRSEDAPFFKNTNIILFIIDPMTMRSSDLEFGDDFSLWYRNNVGNQSDNSGKVDVELALDILRNTLEKHRKRKSEIKNIPVMILLAKADTGYLENIEKADQKQLRSFMEIEMGLGKFVYMVSTGFSNVSYYAVSSKAETGSEISGVDNLIQDIFAILGIENKTT